MSDRDNITLPGEVVEQALEVLEASVDWCSSRVLRKRVGEAIAVLRTALAAEQPKPEPVAWMDRFGFVFRGKGPHETFTIPLYPAPPENEALRRDAERLWQALKRYGKHDDDCGDHDAYNNESMRHCACGLDAVLDETLGDKT